MELRGGGEVEEEVEVVHVCARDVFVVWARWMYACIAWRDE